MTDPRLDEIEGIPAAAVEAAAKEIFNRHHSRYEWDSVGEEFKDVWRQDSTAALEAAHPYLLAELRKAHAALARVEQMADEWEANYGPGSDRERVFGPQKVSIAHAVATIRAAVAAANGDGE